MNYFDIHLNFGEIRERIELDIGEKRPKDWADLIHKSLHNYPHPPAVTPRFNVPHIVGGLAKGP